jgi:hypothetical protein
LADKQLSTGKKLAFVIVVFATFFVVLEGFSSALLFAYELVVGRSQGLVSRQHVMHDPLLGWINMPDLRLEDFYGPGRDLDTNSRSQRGMREYDQAVPTGKRRILCVGDSFTLAIGVDDEEAFCHLLGILDPTLETINLGEAGYGFGQSYLKYEREGADYEHDVLLFSLIEDDFNRMKYPRFLAYEKPFVTAREGELVVLNTPVPRISPLVTWFRKNHHIFDELRSVEVGRRIVNKLRGYDWETRPGDRAAPEEVARLLVEKVAALARSRGATPVFVYFKQDARDDAREEKWRRVLADALEAEGVDFVDLMSPLRELPHDELSGLYDPRWKHFDAEANRRVAEVIVEHVRP